MNEIKSSDINVQSETNKASENFNPDKRVDVSNDVNDKSSNELSTEKSFDLFKRVESSEITDNDIKNYIEDLKDKSEFPNTIPDKPFAPGDVEKCSPEETGRKRENFQGRGEGGRNNPEYKGNIRDEWEKLHGIPWPRYTEANCPSNRKPGDCYDAHHIQPLGMGGKNEASNITPMHADVHYDSRGVHSSDSPYAKMIGKLGGKNND